jgi:small subunit ribosomal protein S1
MVKPYNPKEEVDGGPPPVDEAWWENVLAEEEAFQHPAPARSSSAAPQVKKAAPARPADIPLVDWSKATEIYQQDRAIELDVVGYNRGGLLVSGSGLQGFVPVSHLVELSGCKSEGEQEELLAPYVGRKLALKIIECDKERGRVVYSERAALSESGSRNHLLHHLKPGDCVQGAVTNITDFGVFVDLGGVEGLIHVSELSWGRVRHPTDVVRLGDLLNVYVISIDRERSRVALSLKRMFPNPWETAEERYLPGMVTEAVITSILAYGAFARLEEGLDGLIHISEMAPGGEPVNPKEVLIEGQTVQVRVLHVDAAMQRLGLSLQIES